MLGRKLRSKGESGWTGTSSFVLEVPLCNLLPSIIYSVPCDRILQRAPCKEKSVVLFILFSRVRELHELVETTEKSAQVSFPGYL